MGTGRPTIGELKRCLRDDHGCGIDVKSIFPGNDNADGPLLVTVRNPANGKSVPIEGLDDEEASPSYVEHVCRRLGIEPQKLKLLCSGGPVSVSTPSVSTAKIRDEN